MGARRLVIVFAVVIAALVAIPTAAMAGTVEMRGVVSGSPYGASGGQMAIPVLFSKMTARNTGLKSPVGVIIVKRTQQVKLPNGAGYTIPVNLRTGDRFKGLGVVGALQQKVFYPRVVFPKATVYFRSKELSLAELSAAVDSLRKSLVDLQGQLSTLRDGSIKAFQDVYAQLADLRKALGGLKIPAGVDLTMIQSQIDALKSKLDGLIASLPDFSKFALITQLPDLTQYAKLTDLTNAIAGLASKAYVDNAIAGLQQQLNALPTTQAVSNAIAAALNPYATKTYVDNAVAALTTRVNALCTSLKTATVAIDPDGAGPLPTVQAPVSLPGVATPCP